MSLCMSSLRNYMRGRLRTGRSVTSQVAGGSNSRMMSRMAWWAVSSTMNYRYSSVTSTLWASTPRVLHELDSRL